MVPPFCEYCGWKFLVTKHRIKSGLKGGKYVPGNVIGLCPNCHAMADRNVIPMQVLFDIVQVRLRSKYGRPISE